MHKQNKPEAKWQMCVNWRMFLLLFLLCLVCYSNTFNVPFHFDDFHNIAHNTKLHIENLYPGTIWDAVSGDSGKKLFYRPVSNLSIALNWYFGKTDVTGYHIVNLGIHVLTAFFLYLTILNLFRSPNLAGRFKGDEYFIAVLAAIFWAVNPIQTQAVTYIVQRMASMAAMFYIIGIFCYLRARLDDSWERRLLWVFGALVSFLLAVGSKENAIMLPVSLLLIEVIFFQDMTNPVIRKKMIVIGSLVVLVVSVSGVWLFLSSEFISNILKGYESRTFSLYERLLTQPRVVVFYLSQIFYPIADRLSIDHDIVLSTGLFSPWTTFFSILLILGLIGAAIWQINHHPLLSLAILFFFLNHIIESSVIALELIFEHRNYLPSFFLFLPVAAGINRVMNYYSHERQSYVMKGLLIGFSSILIMMLGLGSYVRNMAWADGKTLWEDTIAKAPGRARAYQNLIQSHYGKIKDYDAVLKLSEKSMYLEDSTRNKPELVSFANMAEVYATHKKDNQKAIHLYERILTIKPDKHDTRHRLVLTLLQARQIENAATHIDSLLTVNEDSGTYLNLKALISLHQNDPETAFKFSKKAVSAAPDDEMTWLNLGSSKMMMGEYDSAEHYLRRVAQSYNGNMTPLLLLVENSVRSGNFAKAEKYADHMLSQFNTAEIFNSLDQTRQTKLEWPLSSELIAPVISERLQEQSRKIQELAETDGT